ncbi:hypothetical protein CEXT_192661 [Caerostris extrusa]|uniref:Uncharacterized protein n=1 Tax=Caerostris extrusa TaxID=172846 RepID=A0AAV4SW57_CAEEX|nr:hypothetical protein CEXT_192661 [Caerostris extrusa]
MSDLTNASGHRISKMYTLSGEHHREHNSSRSAFPANVKNEVKHTKRGKQLQPASQQGAGEDPTPYSSLAGSDRSSPISPRLKIELQAKHTRTDDAQAYMASPIPCTHPPVAHSLKDESS